MATEQYTVKKLAQLAGVSVRTLHLYDQIGLLKPSIRTEKRYRLYGRAEALRLQQILFYKALDMPLQEIGEILDDPRFDPVQSLEAHKKVLQEKREKLGLLLCTIDKTINHLKHATMLNIEDLYEGLPQEQAAAWRQEAKERWGDAVARSENHLRKKSKAAFQQLGAVADANRKRLLAMQDQDPTSEAVQAEVAQHYNITREFWGTAGSPDKQADAYSGLADLYVSDDRFTTIDGVANKPFAHFLAKAMKYFAKRLK